MTTAELLLEDYDLEIANTRRTIERVPAAKISWTPHVRSMSFGKLAMHCAAGPLWGVYIVQDDFLDRANPTHPPVSEEFTTLDACLELLDKVAAECRQAVVSASDEYLAKLWRFSAGEYTLLEAPRSLVFRRVCYNHLVHHTAQLGVYLRLNDIPVPALYGPSADEPWSPPA